MADAPIEDSARAESEAKGRAGDRWAVLLVVGLLAVTAATRLGRPIDRETMSPGPTGYRVAVNVASAGELEALPGVGPALAHAIVEHRSQHGGFAQAAALQAVSGIGPKTAARVEPWIDLSETGAP
ncbi:MAG: helix-hairpin-helix domain-containing protein [Planctomycetota bacterium]